MAILEGDLKIIGTVGNFSFYKVKGTNKTYVRLKGGPSKKMIKQAPSFEVVRKNNKEFGGCSMAGKQIRNAMGSLEGLTNHNFSGFLNAWIKNIMKKEWKKDSTPVIVTDIKKYILWQKVPKKSYLLARLRFQSQSKIKYFNSYVIG